MAHAILNTMLMQNKDIDAMNRVAFYGAANTTTATQFDAAATDNGNLVVMDKMAKFSGYTKIAGTDSRDRAFSRAFNTREGYSYTVVAPSSTASTSKAQALWIVDNHEVGYNMEMQISVDPTKYYNEAGRPISVRKLTKGDIIQVSVPAFTTAPDLSAATPLKYVETDGIKMKAVSAATNAVFNVLGEEDLYSGNSADGGNIKAWILEYVGV